MLPIVANCEIRLIHRFRRLNLTPDRAGPMGGDGQGAWGNAGVSVHQELLAIGRDFKFAVASRDKNKGVGVPTSAELPSFTGTDMIF